MSLLNQPFSLYLLLIKAKLDTTVNTRFGTHFGLLYCYNHALVSGDLLYLEITTLEENKYSVTASSNGFYINK